MTLAIFILGVLTVALSGFIAVQFWYKQKHSKRKYSRMLTKALSWQLTGEAIIGFGTLLFTTAAHFGWLDSWSIGIQSSIRFVMFFATAATSLHLFKTIQRLRE